MALKLLEDLPRERDGPVQFSLRGILILQAVCAVFFALLLTIKIFAVLLAWLATLVYLYVRVQPSQAPLKRLIVDLMGGVILPLLCLAYDPGFFHGSGPWGVLGYLAIGFQILVFLMWRLGGIRSRPLSALAAGMLLFGAILAAVIGLLMSPASAIGVIAVGIGLLGFIPFLTSYVFWQSAREANHLAGKVSFRGVYFILGFVVAVAVPLAGFALFGSTLLALVKTVPWPRFDAFP